jgi:hypothetical protein
MRKALTAASKFVVSVCSLKAGRWGAPKKLMLEWGASRVSEEPRGRMREVSMRSLFPLTAQASAMQSSVTSCSLLALSLIACRSTC